LASIRYFAGQYWLPQAFQVAHVAAVVLEGELGRVDADDGQAVGAVARVPRAHMGQRAQAVDARVGPEVDQHDAPAQALQRERAIAGGVEPAAVAREVGGVAEHLELRAGARAGRAVEARLAAQLGQPVLDRLGALE
jgi:hypothetical protein